MKLLLSLSRAIDAINRRVGSIAIWFVLTAVLISAANAVIRKAFNVSSNAYLEVQWYLFSAVFLLCAGYVLLRNEHVRIDVFIARLSRRKQIWIDIFGLVVFLLPAALLIVYLSWPLFVKSYVSGEMSQNAGGLVRWPVYALLPIGFSLLVAQAISELIKRIAWLRGLIEDPALTKRSKTAEEELAESILAEAEAARK